MFNFNFPSYLIYLLVGVSAAMFAEVVYLLFYNKASYRTNINRRLKVMDHKPDRESVLVQLRRERGLTSGGEYRLPLVNLNRLVLQSGLTIGFGRLIVVIGRYDRCIRRHHGVRGADYCTPPAPRCSAVLCCRSWCSGSCARGGRRNSRAQFPDAIDIIVRSLRAGHPVPIAINMVARELADPIGSEFGTVTDEITYGADLETRCAISISASAPTICRCS